MAQKPGGWTCEDYEPGPAASLSAARPVPLRTERPHEIRSARTPYTIKEAAHQLGLQYWKLQREIKKGQVPSYKFGNGRALVYLSEIDGVIKQSRRGSGPRDSVSISIRP